jgi:hypothetical protein
MSRLSLGSLRSLGRTFTLLNLHAWITVVVVMAQLLPTYSR